MKGCRELMQWVVGWIGFDATGQDRRIALEVLSRHRTSEAAMRAFDAERNKGDNIVNRDHGMYPMHKHWMMKIVKMTRPRMGSGVLQPWSALKNAACGTLHVGRTSTGNINVYELKQDSFRGSNGKPDIEHLINQIVTAISRGESGLPGCTFVFPWGGLGVS